MIAGVTALAGAVISCVLLVADLIRGPRPRREASDDERRRSGAVHGRRGRPPGEETSMTPDNQCCRRAPRRPAPAHPAPRPARLLLVCLAVAGPWLAPHTVDTPVTAPFAEPGDGAPLGGDQLGRDVLSRLLAGAAGCPSALLIAVVVTAAPPARRGRGPAPGCRQIVERAADVSSCCPPCWASCSSRCPGRKAAGSRCPAPRRARRPVCGPPRRSAAAPCRRRRLRRGRRGRR